MATFQGSRLEGVTVSVYTLMVALRGEPDLVRSNLCPPTPSGWASSWGREERGVAEPGEDEVGVVGNT